MHLLCIANPDAYQNTRTDVPLSYARLAAHPGVALFHADTSAMLLPGGQIRATRVEAGFKPTEFSGLNRRRYEDYEPAEFDVVFCRTLKPFPEGYLERLVGWSDHLSFVNNPAGISRQLRPEFFLQATGGHTPPTIITADVSAGSRFLQAQGTIVAKRANSCGGRGVYRISKTASGAVAMDNIVEGERTFTSFTRLFGYLSGEGTESLLLMRYLPRVLEGDRRIVVVDGEIYGTYLRTSADRHWVQNVSSGGRCERTSLDPGDQRIVEATSGFYRKVGIHILGYDMLRADGGDWQISEINAGNIGGLFRLESLGVSGITERFVSWLHAFTERQVRLETLSTRL